MSAWGTKIYIVQKADGEVIAVKLRFTDAHIIAKQHAPARVLFGFADKSLALNVVAHEADQPSAINCKSVISQ
jgi:hypothetical protein